MNRDESAMMKLRLPRLLLEGRRGRPNVVFVATTEPAAADRRGKPFEDMNRLRAAPSGG